MKPCRNDEHIWRPYKDREICMTCGTLFPCMTTCFHIDCLEARKEDLPYWISKNEDV